MSEMSSIQRRRGPQRRLRTIARPLRDSRTGTRREQPRRLLVMNCHQRAPATRKEALTDASWRLDEKVAATAFAASPDSAHKTARFLHRAASNSSFQPVHIDPEVVETPRCEKAMKFSRARPQTQQRQFLAEESRTDANAARASHIARARCGNAPARAAASKSA